MATLEKNRLVLRVAYAGPPLAGKTESIRMLLRLLRGKDGDKHVFSPGEARGRTIFFDWADYEAGTFRGNPIRCQITSVPGQAVLSARREALVKAADAVILVIDSRPDGLEEARRCYGEMAPWLAEADRELAVRVVLQCNKQDLDGSILPELLRSKLGLAADRPSYGTSATTGKGLRPAFIAAVREALNRARTLTDRGLIRFGRPEIDSGQELLERLQREVVATEAPVDTQKTAPSADVTPQAPRAPTPMAAPAAPQMASPMAPPTTLSMRAAEPAPAVPSTTPARSIQANSVASSRAPAVVPPMARDISTTAAAPPLVRTTREGAEPAAPKPRRPAVMPASAWRAQYPDRVQTGTAPVMRLHAESNRTPTIPLGTPPSPITPTLPSASAPPAARDPAPIAQLRADSPLPHAVEPTPYRVPPPLPVPVRPARPAVMPASAYRAANADKQVHAPRIAVVTTTMSRGGDDAPTGHSAKIHEATAIPEKTTLDPATAGDERRDTALAMAEVTPQPSPKPRTRPAVMPASAFRAEFADAAQARVWAVPTTEPWSSVEQASDAPRLPARGLPDEQVCPLAIWRPLEPQMSPSVRAAADPRGGWHGEPVSGWYAHTIDSDVEPAAAHRLYDTAVSRHSALHRYLSKDRCLALTEDVGRWWVWQVVRKVPTLATRFHDWPRAGDSPEASAESLLDCAASYWSALKAIRQAPEALPVTFEKVAYQDGGFVYAGLLPRVVGPPTSSIDDDRDFEDVLRKKLAVRPPPPLHVPAVLEELRKKAAGRLSASVVEMICSVLIGH
jgi:signal recognition particle receptor subunit beta